MASAVNRAKEAANNPTRFYARPAEVVRDVHLSRDEKLAVLRAWELEARTLAVAADENMGGGEPDLLAEVVQARLALADETDPAHRGAGRPTK